MAVKVQILEPQADGPILQSFTTNGTALCLGTDTFTVNVLVLTFDLSFSLTKPANVTPVPGTPGVSEWTASFNPGDNVPDLPYAVYALAYTNGQLVAESDVTVGNGLIVFSKKKGKKAKKGSKKK
jgi:hypothetical protein